MFISSCRCVISSSRHLVAFFCHLVMSLCRPVISLCRREAIQKQKYKRRKIPSGNWRSTLIKRLALRYSARANIPANEQFRKDTKSVKEKAERHFLEALTRYHYRRLESQKSKLDKEKAKARRNNGSVKKDSTKSRTIPPSAETNIVNLRAMATKLQKQYECISKMMSDLHAGHCRQ